LIGGIAVMMWPSSKKSSMDFAAAIMSGGGVKPTCMFTVGRPSMVIFQPSPSSCQSGSSVWPLRHRTLMSTTVSPPAIPRQLANTPATWPAGMVHDAIGRSSVVCAYSETQVISSRSPPSASATSCPASANTAVP
jgi:hypothetical protein